MPPNSRLNTMRPWLHRVSFPLLEPMGRWILAAVFLWAGLGKLAGIKQFGLLIARYGLAPEPLIGPLAVGLPLLEILAGMGLIFGLRGSLELTGALLVLFIGVLWFGVVSDLQVDCGCFSAEDHAKHSGLVNALIRDLWFLLLSAGLYAWRRRYGPGLWRSGFKQIHRGRM